MPITRGFQGRAEPADGRRDRLPPGQHSVEDFPVMSAGPTPREPIAEWTLGLEHDGKLLHEWNWSEFVALPQTEFRFDIHCVTKWSKLDTPWRGVTIDDLFGVVGLNRPPRPFVMAHCDGGYSSNLAVTDLMEGKAMIATHFRGEPLSPAHGGPARLLVPQFYFWKSAKWVRRLQFMQTNHPGFWESRGYHLRGDPWKEQRYAGDT